jgi:hypothetical protein
VLDIALPALELIDFALIDVEPECFEAGLDEGPDERQSHVAETDDS